MSILSPRGKWDGKSPATPDGYTILFSGAALSTFKTLFKELSFDPIEDLVPVAQVYSLASFVVVNPQTPFKTIEEVIADARANPGKLNYGSAGKSTVMIRTEALLRAAGKIIIDQLAAETARYTADPKPQRCGADVGLVYYQSSPEKFRQFIAQESKVWSEVAASVGMKPE